MVPMTIGMVLAAPISGKLSDRFGSRPFATGGMILSAGVFGLLLLLPVNFDYPLFAIIMFCSGLSMGTFGSPNRAGVMNSLPARDSRSRRRREFPHLPELRGGLFTRDLLHPHDPRALDHAPKGACKWP